MLQQLFKEWLTGLWMGDAYIDDLIIYADSREEHQMRLQPVFR